MGLTTKKRKETGDVFLRMSCNLKESENFPSWSQINLLKNNVPVLPFSLIQISEQEAINQSISSHTNVFFPMLL